MVQRKSYCGCDSDFQRFYKGQAGGSFSDIELFRGSPYQRGYGLGSLIGRYSIPLLKFLGKQVLRTGIGVGQDILEKKNVKSALKTRAKEGLMNAAQDASAKLAKMRGGGIKRKVYKKSKKRVKKKKDIFG